MSANAAGSSIAPVSRLRRCIQTSVRSAMSIVLRARVTAGMKAARHTGPATSEPAGTTNPTPRARA